MRRFPKETIFQQQMLLHGTADQEEYPINLENDQEEDREMYSMMQRLHNKRFL